MPKEASLSEHSSFSYQLPTISYLFLSSTNMFSLYSCGLEICEDSGSLRVVGSGLSNMHIYPRLSFFYRSTSPLTARHTHTLPTLISHRPHTRVIKLNTLSTFDHSCALQSILFPTGRHLSIKTPAELPEQIRIRKKRSCMTSPAKKIKVSQR